MRARCRDGMAESRKRKKAEGGRNVTAAKDEGAKVLSPTRAIDDNAAEEPEAPAPAPSDGASRLEIVISYPADLDNAHGLIEELKDVLNGYRDQGVEVRWPKRPPELRAVA